jgi:hypothetical protein
MARQETAAHLRNTCRADQLQDNQLMGWDTSKKLGPDFKATTQQTTEATTKPNNVFVFGTKSPSNQPALPALTQKELLVFGAESSPSQSTLTGPKTQVRPRESFPPCLPALVLRNALTGRRPQAPTAGAANTEGDGTTAGLP